MKMNRRLLRALSEVGGTIVVRGARFAFLLGLAVALLGGGESARAEYVSAPDVVVYCEPTLRHAVKDVATLWRRDTGVPVRLFVSPTRALLEQISHARADLIIGEGDDTAEIALTRHLVKPETRFGGWRNRLVVAEPARTSARIELAQLAEHQPIALVDPGLADAGAKSRQALTHLGLWPALERQALGVVDTADAIFLVTTGKARLAVVYATDVAADPALATAALLPEDSYPRIVYWAAETHNALSSNTKKFAAFLQQPQAKAVLRADGLEIAP